MNDPIDLRARVLAAAASTPAPTRAEGRRRALALASTSVVVAVGLFESIGGLAHSSGRPLHLTFAIAAGWAASSALLTWVALGRGRSTLGRRPGVLAAAALLAPAAMFVWLHAFYGTFAEPFSRFGWRCLGYTIAMSVLPLGSFLALRRGTEPRSPAALGAAVGATCASWAGLLVDLWCPLNNAPHLLVGHVLPLVVVMLAGAAAGARVLAPRLRPPPSRPA